MYRENQPELHPDRSILVVALSGHVVGIDRNTGEIRWNNGLRGGGHGEVFLAIGYGVVVVSAFGDKVFCLDYLTGRTLWEHETSAHGRASIVIEADHIICAKGGRIDCFTPRGDNVWSQPLKGYGLGNIAMGFPGNVAQADDAGSQ